MLHTDIRTNYYSLQFLKENKKKRYYEFHFQLDVIISSILRILQMRVQVLLICQWLIYTILVGICAQLIIMLFNVIQLYRNEAVCNTFE